MTAGDIFFAGVGMTIVGMILMAIGWNYYAYSYGLCTISQCLSWAGSRWPLIAAVVSCFMGVVVGTLIGHWFWPQSPR